MPLRTGKRRCPDWRIQSAALFHERTSVWVNITKASWLYSWEKVWIHIRSRKPGVFAHSLDQAANWDKCQKYSLTKRWWKGEFGSHKCFSVTHCFSKPHGEIISLLQRQDTCLLCSLAIISLVAFASLLPVFFPLRMDIQLLKYIYCGKFTCTILAFQHKCHLGLLIAFLKLGH